MPTRPASRAAFRSSWLRPSTAAFVEAVIARIVSSSSFASSSVSQIA
jgi:hypothetical protein